MTNKLMTMGDSPTEGQPHMALVTDAALLPCPFCGTKDVEVRESITDAMIACNNCGCRTGLVYLGASDASNAARLREVAEVWNTRQTQSDYS